LDGCECSQWNEPPARLLTNGYDEMFLNYGQGC
jgi:hypothetical protein